MTDPLPRQTTRQVSDDRQALYDALLCLETPQEAEAFLADLCTPAELRAFAERWAVARLLDQRQHSYREIALEAGASPTTVVRVARFLKDMDNNGYRLVLDRLKTKA
ncbi:TrpR like protein, YerC/YecD [Brevundimonas vitis]|uniref:TrpR like protein, YerC/YecD n=1 Tax=Brevundimonas vitisensis TaxID=2800818 RepID=A0ABX7BPC2_9CAUL|nr:YerC/YecD family TrpR-related protein [Brevundimonas vitisensis]QQQ17340.1 TrpR like protein, YerC/YecD [Brevundimonas vitisensis]